ncbi:hypothetical protein A2U01_0059684, partial [Trifolium medium]|nr:hypothetical protein [Trifolium medium]
QIEGWSINGTKHHEQKNHQNGQEPVSTTNDYYRQHGVSAHLALSSNIRPNQILNNPTRRKLPTKHAVGEAAYLNNISGCDIRTKTTKNRTHHE